MTDMGAKTSVTEANMRTTSPGWTARRVAAVVAGAILSLVALTLAGLGGTATYMASHDGGYIDLGTDKYAHRTNTYAMATDSWRADKQMGGLLDDLRVTFKPDNPSDPVFVGLAEQAKLGQYLDGIQHVTIHDSSDNGDTASTHAGGTPKTPPSQADVWVAKASGQGAQTLNWTVKSGDVQAVVMKADGSRGQSGHVTVAAKVAGLTWIGIGSLVAGLLLLAGSVWMIVRPVRRARGRLA